MNRSKKSNPRISRIQKYIQRLYIWSIRCSSEYLKLSEFNSFSSSSVYFRILANFLLVASRSIPKSRNLSSTERFLTFSLSGSARFRPVWNEIISTALMVTHRHYSLTINLAEFSRTNIFVKANWLTRKNFRLNRTSMKFVWVCYSKLTSLSSCSRWNMQNQPKMWPWNPKKCWPFYGQKYPGCLGGRKMFNLTMRKGQNRVLHTVYMFGSL